MIATLDQSQAELPRLVELAAQGEEVLITVNGQPKAKLTRPDVGALPRIPQLDLSKWLDELAELRQRFGTGKAGLTVEQILEEDRSDRA